MPLKPAVVPAFQSTRWCFPNELFFWPCCTYGFEGLLAILGRASFTKDPGRIMLCFCTFSTMQDHTKYKQTRRIAQEQTSLTTNDSFTTSNKRDEIASTQKFPMVYTRYEIPHPHETINHILIRVSFRYIIYTYKYIYN